MSRNVPPSAKLATPVLELLPSLAKQVTCDAANPAAELANAIACVAAVLRTVNRRNSAGSAPCTVPRLFTVDCTVVTPSPDPSMSTKGLMTRDWPSRS